MALFLFRRRASQCVSRSIQSDRSMIKLEIVRPGHNQGARLELSWLGLLPLLLLVTVYSSHPIIISS